MMDWASLHAMSTESPQTRPRPFNPWYSGRLPALIGVARGSPVPARASLTHTHPHPEEAEPSKRPGGRTRVFSPTGTEASARPSRRVGRNLEAIRPSFETPASAKAAQAPQDEVRACWDLMVRSGTEKSRRLPNRVSNHGRQTKAQPRHHRADAARRDPVVHNHKCRARCMDCRVWPSRPPGNDDRANGGHEQKSNKSIPAPSARGSLSLSLP